MNTTYTTYPRPMFTLNKLFRRNTVQPETPVKHRDSIVVLKEKEPNTKSKSKSKDLDILSVPKDTKNTQKTTAKTPQKSRKEKIPSALREQVWIQKAGRVFEKKCSVVWCENNITVYDFQCGHNIPESKGGKTTLENLEPICIRCNLSMSDKYSIDEWNALHAPLQPIVTAPNISPPNGIPDLTHKGSRTPVLMETTLHGHCLCFHW